MKNHLDERNKKAKRQSCGEYQIMLNKKKIGRDKEDRFTMFMGEERRYVELRKRKFPSIFQQVEWGGGKGGRRERGG